MGLHPTARYDKITDIPVSFLKENDIKLIFADMDNTLALWHTDTTVENALQWVENVKKENIEVALLTNSKGQNADSIGKKLNISVYKDAKKPFKRVTRSIIKLNNLCPENVLMVGDQLFTDIQLANSLGTKSVLTKPLDKREWWCTKVFNRSREKLVWHFVFKD